MHSRVSRPPVVVDAVLPDAGLVRRLAERNAPYWPVQRYFGRLEEVRALSDTRRGAAAVGPVFRGDWARERPLVDGVEPFLHNEQFIAAAARVFDAAVVRPHLVYANLSLPMPSGDPGHTDVPTFRGVDRSTTPIWFLATMGHSGLFERWRVRTATAVAWFYEGAGGEFTYWPDGPDARSVTRPARTNTAVVGDNDDMFHRVERVGHPGDVMVRGLTLDSQLAHAADGTWDVREAGASLARYPFERIRISVSWKAHVFADATEARLFDEHRDDLAFAGAVDVLVADLKARDIPCARPDDPLRDPTFLATVTKAHHRAPRLFPDFEETHA